MPFCAMSYRVSLAYFFNNKFVNSSIRLCSLVISSCWSLTTSASFLTSVGVLQLFGLILLTLLIGEMAF